MKELKFKVGDIVKATAVNIYRFTNIKNDWMGKVTKVNDFGFEAKTIRSKTKQCKGKKFGSIDYRFFEKVDTVPEHKGKTEKEEPSTDDKLDQVKDTDQLLIELLFLSLGQQTDLKFCKKSTQTIDKKEK